MVILTIAPTFILLLNNLNTTLVAFTAMVKTDRHSLKTDF